MATFSLLVALCTILVHHSSSFRIPYIIGGDPVDPVGKWPWQGSLQILDPGAEEERHTCGCSLISEQWVLTAAHCVDGRTGFSVILGGHDIKTQEQGNPIRHDVEEIIIHEDWDWIESEANDIALILLADVVNLNDTFVSVVDLAPSDAPDYVGYECYITGWGTVFVTSNGSTILPNILQEAQADVWSLEDCEEKYGEDHINDDGHICVGEENESGGCFGDSGGPAVCLEGDTWVQVGVTSFVADEFCDVSFPTVYTRVSFYRQWITDHSGI